MPTRTLYLIRHGQYEQADPSDKLEGALNDIGREQARLTAERMAAYPIAVIHHSTLRRASETAQILGAALPAAPLRPARVLWECIPCIPPHFAHYFEQYPARLIAQHGAQAGRAFERYFKPPGRRDRHEIIICHGNIISYLVCRAMGAPVERWMNIDTRHCGISEVEISSKGWTRINGYGDVGHLPRELRTFV
jgi:serine/threonine-protein phosphatase PGAM5